MKVKGEKITVKQQTAAKIGLVTAISIIISSVVGVGIFFKNGSVFTNNNGNAGGVVVSWVITAVIALFTAISFAEIVTVKKCAGSNAGLGGWSDAFNGYNFGRAVKLWMPTFCYALKTVSMAIFGAAAIVYCVYALDANPQQDWFGSSSDLTMLFILIIAIGIVIFFTTINYFSSKFGTGLSKVSTILKFVPILIIVVIGIGFGIKNGGGLWSEDYSHIVQPAGTVVPEQAGKFDFLGVLNSIPAIMFAFDGFLVVGNIANNVEKPEKNVGASVVVSMIIVVILNLLVTVGCITIGTGNPYDVVNVAFGGIAKDIFVMLVAILIAVSSLGTINAYTIVGATTCQDGIDNEYLMFGKQLKKLNGKGNNLGGVLYYSAISALFFIAFGVPSAILNTIQIFDGVSTISVLLFFAIYAMVIFGAFANRRTHKQEVKKSKLFNLAAPIAMAGCFFIFGYSLAWTYTANVFSTGMNNEFTVWGLAFTPESWNWARNSINPDTGLPGTNLYCWEAMIVFWVTILFFVAYPFINDAVLKATNKNYGHALMWQKEQDIRVVIESNR